MSRLFLISAIAMLLVSCRQDMHDQLKVEPLEGSPFRDGRAAPVIPSMAPSRAGICAPTGTSISDGMIPRRTTRTGSSWTRSRSR